MRDKPTNSSEGIVCRIFVDVVD